MQAQFRVPLPQVASNPKGWDGVRAMHLYLMPVSKSEGRLTSIGKPREEIRI